MKHWDFTQRKFLSLKEAHRHKKAGELLKQILSSPRDSLFQVYRQIETWLNMPCLDFQNPEALSQRFHEHLAQAGLFLKEHNLIEIKTQDKESSIPFLPIHIVLCFLRSAFNVGSIFRTCEAFRLGSLYGLGTTPSPENPKVQKASMGTSDKVSFSAIDSFENLPRPWIALETTSHSVSIHSFSFPSSFTLFLGNEEFGVPKEIVERCDTLLQIPLYGSKNSLNVASAFAITAAKIRGQLDNL